MGTVTRKHLVDRVTEETGLKRTDVQAAVESFISVLMDELGKGERIEIRDFGVFDVRTRKARMAQNPRTLQRISVPAKCTVRFKAGRQLRVRLGEEEPVRSSKRSTKKSDSQVEVKPTDAARHAAS